MLLIFYPFIITFKVTPLPIPSYWSKLSFPEWSQRVELSLKLMDLLDEMETIFDEPLYLCDIKQEHFGLSKEGRVKVIDSDNVALKAVVGKYLEHMSELKLPTILVISQIGFGLHLETKLYFDLRMNNYNLIFTRNIWKMISKKVNIFLIFTI